MGEIDASNIIDIIGWDCKKIEDADHYYLITDYKQTNIESMLQNH